MHPIIESIEQDNYTEFKALIDANPEYLNEKDPDGWSLLSLVTQYEMHEFVNLLLEKMTPEQINSQEPTHPLHVAFENKSTLVDILIKHPKIDLNLKASNGDNLLYYADFFQRQDLSPLLIESEISPFLDNNTGQNAIMHSIETGNVALFDLYTEIPNLTDHYSEDWIKKAIKHNQVTIFKRLHPYSDLSSDTLFNLAISFEHIQIANLILDSGDMIPGQNQITHLIDMMCKKYDDKEDQDAALKLADFLFDSKVPFNRFVNESGESAWMLAVYNDNEIIFDKLSNTNETVNITDESQNTPLFYAITKRNLAFVKSILKKKANVNHLDKNKSTPLIQAVRYGLPEVVAELLKTPNIQVNEMNNNSETALSLAIKMKRIDIAEQLIWHGAEITKNPVKYIEDNSVFQIGLTGNYEKALDNIEEITIGNFVALSKIGLRLDRENDKGDTFLLHFIKNGYLANFKALLQCTFRANEIDSEGNSAIMCAMKKNSDDYALGILWKFKDLDFTIKNHEKETVYDIAAECGSIKRVVALINRDNNLTAVNLEKVLPIIVLSGKMEESAELINSTLPNIASFKDKNNNNTLMLAAIGNNLENFTWLLKQENLKFKFTDLNKKEESIFDIIKKLPEEDALLFNQTISSYIPQSKKNVK